MCTISAFTVFRKFIQSPDYSGHLAKADSYSWNWLNHCLSFIGKPLYGGGALNSAHLL